ncbi:vWA domain-containing protein [Reinekea blandensis]|uniref:VWFA domain-containing protein n=1 Tax=Reinekea blandensis MED297 TaxID=314283 RepID=A4BJU7_9GAMM|nr:VWA domain-containing protein [Reinekea blandensis]EAR07614.1 hypothetical protein MED297_00315 [Reinekea sp. MED297] [Reinekea blandensis MED297]
MTKTLNFFSVVATLMLLSCGTQTTDGALTDPAVLQEPVHTEETRAIETDSADQVFLAASKSRVEVQESYVLPSSTPIIPMPNPPVSENRENYPKTPISPIRQVATDPVSTFSTDVDTASYTNARRFLNQGMRPPADSIRVEEFINYFDYALPAPDTTNTPIQISTERTQTPWNPQTELVRVSLQSYRSDFKTLPPLNLVFLLDVSGSMNSPDKLPLMQRSFNLLVSQLRPQDRVAIAVYAGQSGVVLEPTSGDQKAQINQAINQLRAGGGTHGSAGIHLAYDLAQANYLPDGINRIFIGTDGDFNVGTTSLTELKALIERKREAGVFLSVLGFGTGNYNDALMEELSNHGNGTAYYLDSYQEARKLFATQLAATLQTVAKDVKIQIEFNPAQVAEYRLIGYDNRLLAREDFNNDAIDAGEMGSGHAVTALYEIVRRDSEFRFSDPLRYQDDDLSDTVGGEIAFVKARYKLPDEAHSRLLSQAITDTPMQSSSQRQALAIGVAGFAEILRGSPYLRDWSINDAIDYIGPSLQEDRWGYRQELVTLMRNLQSMEHAD